MSRPHLSYVNQALGGDNAMTEIALALAMGFFAMMVLTLVSMGAGETQMKKQTEDATFLATALAPLASDQTDGANNLSKLQKQDQFFIYYQGSFMDRHMKPVSIASLSEVPDRRVILALNPNLPMGEVLKIRGLLAVENLVISALDRRWLERLSVEFGQN